MSRHRHVRDVDYSDYQEDDYQDDYIDNETYKLIQDVYYLLNDVNIFLNDDEYVFSALDSCGYDVPSTVEFIVEEYYKYEDVQAVDELNTSFKQLHTDYVATAQQQENRQQESKQEASINVFKFDEPSPDDIIRSKKKDVKVHAEPKRSKQVENAKVETRPVSKPEIKQIGHSETKQAHKSKTNAKQIRKLAKEKEALLGVYDSNPSSALNVVIAGHIDSGKSTLSGHLLVLQDRIGQRQLHKLGDKDNINYAWIMDSNSKERSKGITVDVGIQTFSTPGHENIILLDSPGHVDYIGNMISGGIQADCSILVLDGAIDGFERGFHRDGQTKEHAILLKSLGIKHLICVINKMDMVSWDERRFVEIRETMKRFLLKYGFREKYIQFIPCSGLTGENIRHVPESLGKWYQGGKTLIEAIDCIPSPTRNVRDSMRLSISNLYKSSNMLMASGRVDSGSVIVGEELLLLPLGESVIVKCIQRPDGSKMDIGIAGDNIEIGFIGVEDISLVSQGMILCTPSEPVPVCKRFDAQLQTLEYQIPIIKGEEVIIHCHNLIVDGQISKLKSITTHSEGVESEKRKPRFLPSNVSALVRIELEQEVCLDTFDRMKTYGRIMVRRNGKTIAVGIIQKLVQE